MEDFYRIRRLPPYVFEQVNRAKAAARNAGADIIDLGMGNPDLPGIGLPGDAPQRPKEASGYLPVHDLPPDRDEAALNPKEQARIEAELRAARDRQAAAPAPNPAAK